jgi:hypothetical protein
MRTLPDWLTITECTEAADQDEDQVEEEAE